MSSTTDPPIAQTLAVMVTRRCNMECAHCSVESSSRIRQQPSETDLHSIITQAADAGVGAILFTGGEPMLREPVVRRLIAAATRCSLATLITTNGFWGKTLPQARRTLKSLRKAGLGFITLSYDRYHAEFQGPQPGKNILRAAEELEVPMNINVTRVANDTDLASLLAPFEGSSHARVRYYDVQPVGRARGLASDSLRGELEGRCQAAGVPAVTDDGRLTACNGPSYFQPPTSPLAVGSLRESSLQTLLQKHRDDPILETIRLFGPSRLRQELAAIPGFEGFKWKSSYSGVCDLCLHISSHQEACKALAGHLSAPAHQAERAARRMMIDASRERGETGRGFAIGRGAAKVWMSGSRGAPARAGSAWAKEVSRAFGRADADWKQMARYVSACGLSSAVLPVVRDSAVAKWTPSMFVETIEADALREARRELVQRRVVEALSEELEKLGEKGVMLKGGAMLLREISSREKFGCQPGQLPRRSAGDLDIVVPPEIADTLRSRLLDRGATGSRGAKRTGPHHLAPVWLFGLPVEIHTRIMPSWWALPESEMLAHLWSSERFPSLATLDAEGMLLHAFMHSASHLFSCGLRTAWDVSWIIERADGIDYDRLTRWARNTAMSAGFYLPARVMKSTLQIPLPARLLANAPDDRRYAALERVLRERLFIAMEGTSELNAITKHGFFLLLHDTWRGRALHVSSLFRQAERESRAASGSAKPLTKQLHESYAQFRTYRGFASARDPGRMAASLEDLLSDPAEPAPQTSPA